MTRRNSSEEDCNWQFRVIPVLLAVLASVLIGWAISLIPNVEGVKITTFILGALSSAIYLLAYANAGDSRSALVIKCTSLTAMMVSNAILALMAIWCQTPTYFILVVALFVLCFIAITYKVAKSNQ